MKKKQVKQVPTIPAEPLSLIPPPEPPSLKDRLMPILKGFIVICILGGGIWAFRHYGIAEYIDKAALQALVEPFGIWAPGVFVLLCILSSLAVVVPFYLMAGLSSLLFGAAWGSFWTVIGCTLGSALIVLTLRTLGKDKVSKRLQHPRWRNMNSNLEKDGFYYLLLVRALSILPYSFFNVACAFIKVRYRDIFWANLIGLIPASLLYGYGTHILLNPKTPKSTLIAFALIALLLITVPVVFREIRRRKVRKAKI